MPPPKGTISINYLEYRSRQRAKMRNPAARRPLWRNSSKRHDGLSNAESSSLFQEYATTCAVDSPEANDKIQELWDELKYLTEVISIMRRVDELKEEADICESNAKRIKSEIDELLKRLQYAKEKQKIKPDRIALASPLVKLRALSSFRKVPNETYRGRYEDRPGAPLNSRPGLSFRSKRPDINQRAQPERKLGRKLSDFMKKPIQNSWHTSELIPSTVDKSTDPPHRKPIRIFSFSSNRSSSALGSSNSANASVGSDDNPELLIERLRRLVRDQEAQFECRLNVLTSIDQRRKIDFRRLDILDQFFGDINDWETDGVALTMMSRLGRLDGVQRKEDLRTQVEIDYLWKWKELGNMYNALDDCKCARDYLLDAKRCLTRANFELGRAAKASIVDLLRSGGVATSAGLEVHGRLDNARGRCNEAARKTDLAKYYCCGIVDIKTPSKWAPDVLSIADVRIDGIRVDLRTRKTIKDITARARQAFDDCNAGIDSLKTRMDDIQQDIAENTVYLDMLEQRLLKERLAMVSTVLEPSWSLDGQSVS